MFTGIVREVGTVRRCTRRGATAVVEVAAPATARQLSVGDSVAVGGACLTVTEVRDGWFAAELSDETLAATILGAARPGRPVNLEPALLLSDRLGGHLVTGHVDGVGAITRCASKDGILEIGCRVPSEVVPYLVPKGSVAMDGVSLTVVGVEGDEFTVTVISHTGDQTTLGSLQVGDKVNLEADLIGKYVQRFVLSGATASATTSATDTPEDARRGAGEKREAPGGGRLSEGRLRELGFK